MTGLPMMGSTISLNFAGVRRGNHDPGRATFGLTQAAIDFRRGRRVRAPFASIAHEILSDASSDCSVIDTVGAQLFAYFADTGLERPHALHIAGVPDIHAEASVATLGPRLPDRSSENQARCD